jgi:hypothetical protein
MQPSLAQEATSCAATQELSQYFTEPEGSLLCSQEPFTGSYPEPEQSNPHNPILSLQTILILSTHLRTGPPSGTFLSGFTTNNLHLFLFSPFVLHALPISSSLASVLNK